MLVLAPWTPHALPVLPPTAPRRAATDRHHRLNTHDAGETTAVGEPKPGPGGRVQQYAQPPYGQVAGGGARGVGGQMVSLVATGAGIGLVFALLRHVF